MPVRKAKAAKKTPRPRRTRKAATPNEAPPQVVAPVDYRKSRDGNVAPGREGSTR